MIQSLMLMQTNLTLNKLKYPGCLNAISQYYTDMVHGSIILSIILFSIFINGIFDLKLNGKLQLYAEDAVIVYANCILHDLLID